MFFGDANFWIQWSLKVWKCTRWMAQWPLWAKPEDNQFFDEVSWTGFSLTISLLLELFFYHKRLIMSNFLKSCCIVSIVDPQGSYLMGILVPWSCETNSFLFSWPGGQPLKLHHGRKLRISDTQKRRYHSISNFYVPSILACSFQSSTPSRMLCLRWCQGGNQCHGFGITDDSSERIRITALFPPFMFLRFIYKTLDSSLRCLPGWW